MKVYLAGPMRGYPRFNFDSFEHAARLLRAHGIDVVSPAEHDIEGGFDPSMTLEEQSFDLGSALLWDLTQIATEVDAVVVLPGWEKSKGVAAELATARAVGKPVTEFVEDLDHDDFELLRVDEDDQRSLIGEHVQAVAAQRAAGIISYEEACQMLGLTTEIRVTDPTTGGQKGSKLARFDLIPAGALWQLAEHYGRGALKYDDDNWRKGYSWRLSFAAMQRHAWAWFNGEDIDQETGSSHMTAVAWHAFTLLTFAADGLGTDDRYGKAAS